MSRASNDVLAERDRQINIEGYDAEHDDLHTPEQIARAGIAYALLSMQHPDSHGDRSLSFNSGGKSIHWQGHAELLWPWKGGPKPHNQRRDLIRAAALLIAAIDRLDS